MAGGHVDLEAPTIDRRRDTASRRAKWRPGVSRLPRPPDRRQACNDTLITHGLN